MSTKSNPVPFNPPQTIILKGFNDEPLRLLAIADRGDSIEVARELSDEPMPFHAAYIFKFDADIYAELERAATRRDARKLNQTWERAKPFRRIA